MAVKNYLYGAKQPIENLEGVQEQMFLAHRYKNRLVEIERNRREEQDQALRDKFKTVDNLHLAYDAAKDAYFQAEEDLKNKRQKARVRVKATDEESKQIKYLRQAKNQAYDSLKKEKNKRWKSNSFKGISKKINDKYLQMVKDSRADVSQYLGDDHHLSKVGAKLFWGSYCIVEDAAKKFKQGPPPNFKKNTGDGTIGVQLQKKQTAAYKRPDGTKTRDMMSDGVYIKNPNTWLEPMPHRLWKHSKPAPRWYLLHIRIGTDENRKPIMASLPVSMHRPLPPESKIKWVKVLRKKVGQNYNWNVLFVVDAERFDNDRDPGTGTVAIDFGFKKTENGIRVASWVGSDGGSGEVVIPESEIPRWTKVNSLQNIADSEFDSVRDGTPYGAKAIFDQFVQYYGDKLPDWLIDEIPKNNQLSMNRLRRIVEKWRGNRFEGDEHVYPTLEAWRKQRLHLYNWQRHGQVKAIAWRDHFYRNFVAEMRSRYEKLILPYSNFAEMQKLPNPEDEDAGMSARNRKIASPGKLMEFLKEKMPYEISKVKSAEAHKVCHICKHENDLSKSQADHVCEKCGEIWDIDQNACKNRLIASGCQVTKSQEPLEVAV